jgi:hypothetical protein
VSAGIHHEVTEGRQEGIHHGVTEGTEKKEGGRPDRKTGRSPQRHRGTEKRREEKRREEKYGCGSGGKLKSGLALWAEPAEGAMRKGEGDSGKA